MRPMRSCFADPMCRWCGGFSPVIDQIREYYSKPFVIHLILGGPPPATSNFVGQQLEGPVREHRQRLTELSGQAFDTGFFELKALVNTASGAD